MFARYYSSGLARFLAVDPAMTISKNLSMPQRWNRYHYTLNNPLTYVDPNGEDIVLAGDLTPGQETYLRDTLAQVAANPIGAAIIGALEDSMMLVVITELKIEEPALTGTTGMFPDSGVIGIVVDMNKSETAEAIGADTHAQNLAEELLHALQLIEVGETSEEDPLLLSLKAAIAANSPANSTRSYSDAMLNSTPNGPSTNNGRLFQDLRLKMDAAAKKQKELEAANE